jgi:hypothetical protein
MMCGRRLPNTFPTKPWVRRWMLWVVGFFVSFLPRTIWDLLTMPISIIRYQWVDLYDDVMSFEIKKKESK